MSKNVFKECLRNRAHPKHVHLYSVLKEAPHLWAHLLPGPTHVQKSF